MKTRDERIDRMLGYAGLFIIGVLGWTADRVGELRATRVNFRRSTSPTTRHVNA